MSELEVEAQGKLRDSSKKKKKREKRCVSEDEEEEEREEPQQVEKEEEQRWVEDAVPPQVQVDVKSKREMKEEVKDLSRHDPIRGILSK